MTGTNHSLVPWWQSAGQPEFENRAGGITG
jgi:hypothetical protein